MRIRVHGVAKKLLRRLAPSVVERVPAPEAAAADDMSATQPATGFTAPSKALSYTLEMLKLTAEAIAARARPDAHIQFGCLEVFYHASSDTGLVRKRNEDACGLFIPPDPGVLAARGVLAVVADGMGGHECGDRASSLVLETVGKAYYDSAEPDPGEALAGAVSKAHEALLSDAAASHHDMGSTCSALLICCRGAYAAHVGDSRIYRLRDGRLEQLTEDESMVAEMVRRGMLAPERARSHPGRSVLLNALGQGLDLKVARWPGPQELRSGDVFLVCSDGLHSLLEDPEIAELIAGAPSLTEANRRLVGKALERGGTDNVSSILVRVFL